MNRLGICLYIFSFSFASIISRSICLPRFGSTCTLPSLPFMSPTSMTSFLRFSDVSVSSHLPLPSYSPFRLLLMGLHLNSLLQLPYPMDFHPSLFHIFGPKMVSSPPCFALHCHYFSLISKSKY